jgi:hypothetical protein
MNRPCLSSLLFLVSLGGACIYEQPAFAMPDKNLVQKKFHHKLRLPKIMEILPYSQDGVQKFLTLWCVEVPYSDEAFMAFVHNSSVVF